MSTTQARTDAPPVPTSTTGPPVRRYPLGWLRGARPVTSLLARDFSMRFGS